MLFNDNKVIIIIINYQVVEYHTIVSK